MSMFEIVVGNVGTVHTGEDEGDARLQYGQWVLTSTQTKGSRAIGENVTLLKDGEPIKEHEGWATKFDTCGPI